ncbi:MAG: hypothetical protein LBF78_13110 [Treponema sp.]|nr:hypothetical protein [Treponema sp.]
MKRLIAFIMIFGFVAAIIPAADFSWTAWGRGVFSPVSFSGEDSSVSAATHSSADQPRITFALAGTADSELVGFNADFYWDGGIPAVGESANVWAQPFDFLRLKIGKFNENDYRGIIGNTEFAGWILPNSGKDEDAVFTRFQATGGAFLAITPLFWLNSDWNGLSIEASIGSSYGGGQSGRNVLGMDALDVYKAIQIGLGYTIPTIGFFRAQFIGNNRAELLYLYGSRTPTDRKLMEGLTKNRDADVVELAFSFTMIEDLTVELGAKLPFKFETDAAIELYPALYPIIPTITANLRDSALQLPCSFALGAVYALNDFNILARVDLSMGGQTEQINVVTFDYGMTLNFWLNPSYRIYGACTVGLDIGMEMHTKDTKTTLLNGKEPIENSEYFDFGFGPWVEKDLGGGSIKLGLMVMFPGTDRYSYDRTRTPSFIQTFSTDPVISIPISITYSL